MGIDPNRIARRTLEFWPTQRLNDDGSIDYVRQKGNISADSNTGVLNGPVTGRLKARAADLVVAGAGGTPTPCSGAAVEVGYPRGPASDLVQLAGRQAPRVPGESLPPVVAAARYRTHTRGVTVSLASLAAERPGAA